MSNAIIGIDLAKGSPLAREAPEYAVAIVRDGDAEIEKYASVSIFKLLRLIAQERPAIVAVDNIYELAGDKRELIALLRKFPACTRLVQVTGSERKETLVRIAGRYGISFDRLNPVEEAGAIARLAALGAGFEVSVFEDRTILKVSRARSPGRGGWSQNRYRRKVHGEVLQRVREIEKEIRDKGLKFDLVTRRAFGGYSSGEFLIEAKKGKVGIREHRYEDVQIKVEAVEREGIKFNPLMKKHRYVIAGIDPGTTTAIAILDLDGNLKSITSSRVFSFSDIVEHVSDSGDPLVIATDVVPTPATVEKVKRVFNAVLYTPSGDISTDEKINLARRFAYANDHERDAIAAALLAFNSYKSKFVQVEKKSPARLDLDEIKAMVVRGISVDSAILQLSSTKALEAPQVEPEAGAREKPSEESLELKSELKRQAAQIGRLKNFLEELKADLKAKDEEIIAMSEKIESLKTGDAKEIRKKKEIEIRDKEIAVLKAEISKLRKTNQQLESRIQKLRKIKTMEASGRALPIKIVSAFAKEAILKAEKEFGLKQGDIVFLEDASGGGAGTAELLMAKQIAAIIIGSEMSHIAWEKFLDANIPVLTPEEVPVNRAEGFAAVDPEKLEKAIANYRAKMERHRADEKAEMIELLLKEYKVERSKEVKK